MHRFWIAAVSVALLGAPAIADDAVLRGFTREGSVREGSGRQSFVPFLTRVAFERRCAI